MMNIFNLSTSCLTIYQQVISQSSPVGHPQSPQHRSAAAARAAELQEELQRLEEAKAQAVKDAEASRWALEMESPLVIFLEFS